MEINMNLSELSELSDEATTTDLLKLKAGTLAVWRCTGRYDLPYVKVGRRVLYRKHDIIAFIERNTITQASEVNHG